MTASSDPSDDTAVEVRGYTTDPTRTGYQVLTNYESTYWRALAGSDAWSLYEVLRSFCHQGHNQCHPSINLLMAILGVKDRSVLIGRSSPKVVNGREYHYPGLIEVLQQHDLVIAETVGEGPVLRYRFHVNLTPGQLTPAQVARLPEVLQRKHAQLLERCREKEEALKAAKRPPKGPEPADDPDPDPDANEGIGNSHTPIGNSNTPSWNFQHKQHPMNITHNPVEQNPKNNHHGLAAGEDSGGGFDSSSIPEELVASFTDLAGHEPDETELRNLAVFAQYEPRIVEETLSAAYDWTANPAKDKLRNPAGWLVGTARRKVENENKQAEREAAARVILARKGGKNYVPEEYASIIVH